MKIGLLYFTMYIYNLLTAFYWQSGRFSSFKPGLRPNLPCLERNFFTFVVVERMRKRGWLYWSALLSAALHALIFASKTRWLCIVNMRLQLQSGWLVWLKAHHCCLVKCSRRNEVNGIALYEFMEYFLGEFSDDYWSWYLKRKTFHYVPFVRSKR